MKKFIFTFWINEQDSPDRKKKFLTIIGKPYICEKDAPNGYIWISKDAIRIPLLTCYVDVKRSSENWSKIFSLSRNEAVTTVRVLIDAEILLNVPVRYTRGVMHRKTRWVSSPSFYSLFYYKNQYQKIRFIFTNSECHLLL